MVQKRPYDEEDVFRISFKHPRQVEHRKELFLESVFPEDASETRCSLEDGFKNVVARDDKKLSGDVSINLPKVVEDTENCEPGGCFSISSWPTSSTSEEESLTESPFHVSLFADYRSPERPVRTLARCEDMYTLLVNHPPRKAVPIGPDHQADIPQLIHQHPSEISSLSLNSNEASQSEAEYEKRLMGTCVIPMPDLTSRGYTDTEVGSGRSDCNCEDRRSIRCVRKHIKEARVELVKTIGEERFTELGLCDMGEEVARCWSEEEEHTFHQVVFSNPAVLGKNFWEKLSSVFPFRTKKEIVSYYFNVFMLQKRADQNRYDPSNIDSDNDEWPGNEDFRDDDSVVESPIYTQNREDYLHEYNDTADDTCEDDTNLDFNQFSETQPEKVRNYRSGQRDQEVQDDSCTSFDASGPGSRTTCSIDTCPSNFTGPRNHVVLGNGENCPSSFNGYVLEPCYSKDWDVGFTTCSKNKVDFLPTCHMIEEVFGEEMRNYKVRDGNNLG